MSNVKKGNDALAKGNALFRKNDFTKAVEQYEEAVKFYANATGETVNTENQMAVTNNLSVAYDKIGVAFLNESNNEKAIDAFSKAVKANDKSFSANYNLGFAQQKAGKYDHAISSFEAAEKLKGDDSNTLYNLAVCYKAGGRNADAIKKFQESIKSLESGKVNETLTIHNQIIETALSGKDQDTINTVAKAAFDYAKTVKTEDYAESNSALNYIMVHYGKLCLNNDKEAENLGNIVKLNAQVNPSQPLHKALIGAVYHGYNSDQLRDARNKVIEAVKCLKLLLNKETFADVKEAVGIFAQQHEGFKDQFDAITMAKDEADLSGALSKFAP